VQALALADEKIKGAIAGKEIVKVLVVKGRLVNVAVK
jgi:leucyl-tRNA synthetase